MGVPLGSMPDAAFDDGYWLAVTEDADRQPFWNVFRDMQQQQISGLELTNWGKGPMVSAGVQDAVAPLGRSTLMAPCSLSRRHFGTT